MNMHMMMGTMGKMRMSMREDEGTTGEMMMTPRRRGRTGLRTDDIFLLSEIALATCF